LFAVLLERGFTHRGFIMSSGSARTRWAGPEDWDAQHNNIKKLYWDQNLPLKEVVEIMQREHHFYAT
jgi:hypothetical protein